MSHRLTLLRGLAATALVMGTATAQESGDSVKVLRIRPSWSNGSVNFQLGATQLGLDALNNRMVQGGRPAFALSAPTIGISGYARFGRLLLGGSGESAIPSRELSPGWISKITFGSALVNGGVAVVDSKRMLLAPQVGIGVRKTSLRMERSGDYTYDEAIQDPARGIAMSSISGVWQFGMVTEMRVQTRMTGAFSIGARAGMSLPFGGPTTSAGEARVHNAPREDAGHYLALSFGRPIGAKSQVIKTMSSTLLSFVGK
jgi:hypothetical protein